MIDLLEEASDLFREAHLFEAVSEVYKIVLPIYEAHRNHVELEKAYSRLSECYKELVHRGEHRFLGSYFRVGFYGLIFGDMDQAEFIYKEAALTRLGEFSIRLQVISNGNKQPFCPELIPRIYYRNSMRIKLELLT